MFHAGSFYQGGFYSLKSKEQFSKIAFFIPGVVGPKIAPSISRHSQLINKNARHSIEAQFFKHL